jgi:hypothetical protein
LVSALSWGLVGAEVRGTLIADAVDVSQEWWDSLTEEEQESVRGPVGLLEQGGKGGI